MIMPKDVITRNKFRDAKLLNEWMEGKTQEQLALENKCSRMNIYQIIRKNRSILKLDRDFDKINRVHILKNSLSNSKPSEKDRVEIVAELRKEYEGENVLSISNFLVVDKPKDSEPNRLDAFLANQ